VLAFAGSAVAGGDERHAPPSAGPPGSWDDREVREGEDVPYKPTDARGFLAFPGEKPPSIECNEDAEEEFSDG
jgi:hypothetical protein